MDWLKCGVMPRITIKDCSLWSVVRGVRKNMGYELVGISNGSLVIKCQKCETILTHFAILKDFKKFGLICNGAGKHTLYEMREE